MENEMKMQLFGVSYTATSSIGIQMACLVFCLFLFFLFGNCLACWVVFVMQHRQSVSLFQTGLKHRRNKAKIRFWAFSFTPKWLLIG